MPRLSPITLGLAAIMTAVLGGGVFLLLHSRQPRREPKEIEPIAEMPPPAPPPRAPEAAPPPPPPAAPAAAVVETPAELDAQAPPEETPAPAAPNRRGLLVINHNRRMEEADENVFATLALPDSTRASIRQINDDYRRRTEAGADAGTTLAPADAAAALKARHDALALLLGADSAKSFDAEERIAVLRLRGKYRYEWGRQLRQ